MHDIMMSNIFYLITANQPDITITLSEENDRHVVKGLPPACSTRSQSLM